MPAEVGCKALPFWRGIQPHNVGGETRIDIGQATVRLRVRGRQGDKVLTGQLIVPFCLHTAIETSSNLG